MSTTPHSTIKHNLTPNLALPEHKSTFGPPKHTASMIDRLPSHLPAEGNLECSNTTTCTCYKG